MINSAVPSDGANSPPRFILRVEQIADEVLVIKEVLVSIYENPEIFDKHLLHQLRVLDGENGRRHLVDAIGLVKGLRPLALALRQALDAKVAHVAKLQQRGLWPGDAPRRPVAELALEVAETQKEKDENMIFKKDVNKQHLQVDKQSEWYQLRH